MVLLLFFLFIFNIICPDLVSNLKLGYVPTVQGIPNTDNLLAHPVTVLRMLINDCKAIKSSRLKHEGSVT